MTVGRKEYTEAELLRMQRDAEERVREMHSRARHAVEQEPVLQQQQRNRNWNANPNMRRPNSRRMPPEPPREPKPEPEQPAPEAREQEAPEQPPAAPQEKTTVVEDVMRALSLDEDYLLIIGLLLILLNQRADTTLILALAYLLI